MGKGWEGEEKERVQCGTGMSMKGERQRRIWMDGAKNAKEEERFS